MDFDPSFLPLEHTFKSPPRSGGGSRNEEVGAVRTVSHHPSLPPAVPIHSSTFPMRVCTGGAGAARLRRAPAEELVLNLIVSVTGTVKLRQCSSRAEEHMP